MTFNFCCKNSRSMTKRKNVFLMTDLGLKTAKWFTFDGFLSFNLSSFAASKTAS